jgi:RNA polymerase sigma factor (sigma-70 family)
MGGKAYHVQRKSPGISEGCDEYSHLHKSLEPYNPLSKTEEKISLLKFRGLPYPVVTKNGVIRICDNGVNKEETRHDFIMRNMRLVLSRVKEKRPHYDPAIMELISAGSDGLLRAAAKFKLKKGTAFSTYAVRWIDSRVGRELSRMTRRGPRTDEGKQYINAEKVLKILFMRKPSAKEVFGLLGWTEEQIQVYLKHKDHLVLLNIENETKKMDTEAGTDFFKTLVAVYDPNEECHNVETSRKLSEAYDLLSIEEKAAVYSAYGYGDSQYMDGIKTILQSINSEPEKGKQFERRALKKLYMALA